MRLFAASIALAAILIVGAGTSVEAQTFIGGTTSLTLVGTPSAATVGFYTGLMVTFHNNLNVPVQAVVFMVLRNSQGAMIYYTADFLNLNASSTQLNPNFLVAGAIAQGNYNATVFAVATPSGVALTNSTTGVYAL